MDEDQAGNLNPSIVITEMPRRAIKADELLNIAKRIDQFISDNGWFWCDMRQVYRILETIHG